MHGLALVWALPVARKSSAQICALSPLQLRDRTARAAALGSAHHDHMKYYIPTLTHNPLSLVQTDPQLVQELSDEVAIG